MAPRPQVSPARRAAFTVLQRVFEDGAYADRALRSASEGLDERDRALARQLAYGSIQRARTLDHAIEALGRRPARKLDPPVRAALRLGCYQLAFLDGVPRYAAVNESVELVRRARLERAVPFANAVLRRLADGARSLVAALAEKTPREAALRHSYPDWIAETWWRELGPDEARALMAAQNEEPETAVRLVRGEIAGRPDPLVPGAWVVLHRGELALYMEKGGRTLLTFAPFSDPDVARMAVETLMRLPRRRPHRLRIGSIDDRAPVDGPYSWLTT